MFKNWSSWLGAEKESGQVTEEPADANEEKRFSEINKPSDQQGRDAGTDAQLLQKAKGFSGESAAVHILLLCFLMFWFCGQFLYVFSTI